MQLSERAHAWLASLDASTITDPNPTLPMPWPVLSSFAAALGRTHGRSSDTRELNLGVEAETRMLFGREHVLVGNFGPIDWWMDAEGTVVEVDELGHTFHRADSGQKRIEQLAMDAVLPAGELKVLEGAHGASLAARAGLTLVPEPSDSWRRFYEGEGIIVVESTEPVDYGAKEIWTVTCVYAASPELLRGVLVGSGH